MLQGLRKAKVYDRARSQMARMENAADAIRQSPSLTPIEKRDQLQEIKVRKRDLMRRILEQWGPE